MTAVKAGQPTSAPQIEPAASRSVGEFAKRLSAASEIYLHSSADAQHADNASKKCPIKPTPTAP